MLAFVGRVATAAALIGAGYGGAQVLPDLSGAAAAPPAAVAPAAPSSAPAAPGRVNLNTATAEELQARLGISRKLALAIGEWRVQHGSFTSVAQLDEVKGFGPKTFGKVRDLVTV